MDENVLARPKPNSFEAEQSVIGTMLMDSSSIDEVAEILVRDDFYYQQYGIVYEAIVEVKNLNQNVNLVTVIDRLRQKNAPPEVCEGRFLGELAESAPISGSIAEYAQIVKRNSILRNIIDKNNEIIDLCYQGNMSVDEIMDITEKNFLSLLQKRGIGDAVPIVEVVDNAIELIKKAFENKGSITGIPTGFIDLDAQTSGLQPSDFILVAARPSMGKTAFALNIAGNVAFKSKLPVAVFSLEMSQESLMLRLFSVEAGIDASKLRSGNLDDNDWVRLIESADDISKSKLIIDETPGITISQLRSKCRKYKQQHDIQLVVIDYLQLISGGGKSESKQQEISAISRALKVIARELKVPVIALSQLNRGPEMRDDKRPMLSDLRDSGAIEQDADVVILLYRDDYYNHDSPKKGVSEVIIAKQRNGPTGTVELSWLAKYTRFANRDKAKTRVDIED